MLRSTSHRYNRNLLPIYIIEEELSSSDIPHPLTRLLRNLHQRHATRPARTARRFYFFCHAFTRQSTSRSHTSMCFQQPADVICNIILLTSAATSILAFVSLHHHPRHLADDITPWLTLTVDFCGRFDR